MKKKAIGWFNCDCLMFDDICEHYLGMAFPYSLCYDCSRALPGYIQVKAPGKSVLKIEERECESCNFYKNL